MHSAVAFEIRSFSLAIADTAFQALYLRHKLAQPDKPITTKEPFLIWGGSSSVGLYAIQLASLSGQSPLFVTARESVQLTWPLTGYTVITTASPKNFDLVKSFGASAVYDYNDADTPSKIASDYPDLARGMDCVSEKGTTLLIAKSFAEKKGTIITILPVKDEALDKDFPEVHHEFTLVYTVLGDEFNFGPMKFEANREDFEAIKEW